MNEKMMDVERAKFNDYLNEVVETKQVGSLTIKLQRHDEYTVDDEKIAWDAWQARASQPVGVPDGWKLVPAEAVTPELQWPISEGVAALNLAKRAECCDEDCMHDAINAMLAAAPTVKAEQVPTPEFVWVRLMEALAGDNGCAFTASTDEYREAKPALVELIAAGFFRDTADSLDGDIWTVAAGEQGEAADRFASCADAYAALSNVLNRVFDRPEEAPSLQAAGSAVEEVEVVAWVYSDTSPEEYLRTKPFVIFARPDGAAPGPVTHQNQQREPLMTVAQHNRIVAALSAQQSAPERVR